MVRPQAQAFWFTADDLRSERSSKGEESEHTRSHLQIQLAKLEQEEKRLRGKLPDYVQKLVLGYELRTYYFEIIE